MHLRSPSCRGASYRTDRSAAPHEAHVFFPHAWAEAVPCPGWSGYDARMSAIVEQVRQYGVTYRGPGEARLEAHPAVIAGIMRLLEPDFADMADFAPGAQVERLFGVLLAEAPLGRGQWRLVPGEVTAGG